MASSKTVTDIINDPMNTLKKMTTKQIVTVLEAADTAFFNTDQTILSDDIYDIVKEYLKKTDSTNAYLKKVGAQVEFNKEKLPFYMGSLDKIKDNEAEITKWKNKYAGSSPEYIISEKLDGISCMIYHKDGVTKMYSRGDGTEGQNISHILPHMASAASAASILASQQFTAIRGELIISRKKWKDTMGSNARNVVAGAIHSKTLNRDILANIDFVAYDMMSPRLKLGDALKLLEDAGVHVARHMTVTDAKHLTLDMLSTTLQDWRKTSAYEIDGIVVQHNDVYKITPGKNPKYAFAFKTIVTHEQEEVIVTDVEWNTSKHRYLKPLVKFNEVSLGGVKIKQATGFNGAYIESNKIGPGARIVIVRSGDVIPHIISVLKPANGPKMPSVPYVWNETRIDVMLSGDEKNKEQDIQAFSHFMKVMEVDGIKEGVLTKLYDAGHDTLAKIVHISLEDLQKVEGFKEKSAQKIHDALQGMKLDDCNRLMVASNSFGRGFGDRKLQLITAEHPYIATDKQKALKLTSADLVRIKGIAEITAKQFIEKLPVYYEFVEGLKIQLCNPNQAAVQGQQVVHAPVAAIAAIAAPKSKKISEVFHGMKVVFSGFRNKDYEKVIKDNGGIIVTTISSATNYLIVKDIDNMTGKVEKAMQLGVKIMSKDELERLMV